LPPQVLKAGDSVHLLRGPFAQFVATVAAGVGAARLLGGQTRVSVDVAQLRSA